MFRALVAIFLISICLSTTAAAVEPCEGLIDTARVVAISESTRQVAVRRAKEVCQSVADGSENRQTRRYVEMWHLDTGKVQRRFAPDAKVDAKQLSKTLGVPVGQWTEYTRVLKEGLFQRRPPVMKNRFCSVSLSIESGGLAAIVDGRDPRGKPLRATIRLLDAVKPGAAAPGMARAWFARNGAALVFDIEAPVPEGHHSAVRVVTAEEAPVLKGCATPKARPKAQPR